MTSTYLEAYSGLYINGLLTKQKVMINEQKK
jgi:hypothetical protein